MCMLILLITNKSFHDLYPAVTLLVSTVAAAANLLRGQQNSPYQQHRQQPEAVALPGTGYVTHETAVIPSQGNKSMQSSSVR